MMLQHQLALLVSVARGEPPHTSDEPYVLNARDLQAVGLFDLQEDDLILTPAGWPAPSAPELPRDEERRLLRVEAVHEESAAWDGHPDAKVVQVRARLIGPPPVTPEHVWILTEGTSDSYLANTYGAQGRFVLIERAGAVAPGRRRARSASPRPGGSAERPRPEPFGKGEAGAL